MRVLVVPLLFWTLFELAGSTTYLLRQVGDEEDQGLNCSSKFTFLLMTKLGRIWD